MLLLLWLWPRLASVRSERPHIVLVLADDLGWADLNYTRGGASSLPTPHLDQLAAGGVRLSSHYTQPTCTPTRGDIASRLISSL